MPSLPTRMTDTHGDKPRESLLMARLADMRAFAKVHGLGPYSERDVQELIDGRCARSAVVASTQDELRAKYKASSPEDRQRLIHEHDCPRVWDFWRKHSSGSKLCPSCLMCGQQSFDRADWAITHLELPDIYICKVCVDKTRTPVTSTPIACTVGNQSDSRPPSPIDIESESSKGNT